MTVEQGRAMLSQRESESRSAIPVDAIFSPIRRVSFDEPTCRVSTNYDNLVIEIETVRSRPPTLASAAPRRSLVDFVASMSDGPRASNSAR